MQSADGLERELADARATIRSLRGQLELAARDVADARRTAEAAIAARGRAEAHLTAVHRSQSWRVTRPLRAIKRRRLT